MLPYFRFHHIGIATYKIDETATMYTAAGYVKTSTVYDPIQNVYICFLKKEGMPTLELLAPHDDKSPVCKTLEKNGVIPYHCCYEVENLEQAAKDLRALQYVPICPPEVAVAFEGKKVQFFYNKQIGLIELVEIKAI